jgi:hypothetical protein
MDDDTEDLAIQWCTRIGILMKDASAAALTIRGIELGDRPAALLKIEWASEQIHALMTATKALLV